MKIRILFLSFIFLFSFNSFAADHLYYSYNLASCVSSATILQNRNSAIQNGYSGCDPVPTNQENCQSGNVKAPFNLYCHSCPSGLNWNGSVCITCSNGTSFDESTLSCRVSCPTGATNNTPNSCICSDGFSPTGSPLTCDRPTPVCQPPQAQITTATGNVICGNVCTGGQYNNSSGACVCGAGSEMFNGTCRQVCTSDGITDLPDCIAPCLPGHVRTGPGGTCLNPSDLCAVCYNYDSSAHTCVPDTNQNCAKTGYQDPDQLDKNGVPGDGSVKKPGTAGDPSSVDNTPKSADDGTNTAKTGEGTGTGTNSHKRGLSSPDCKTTPECSSENPIECAQLRQTWNLMCYSVPFDPAEIQSYIDNNPGSDVVKTDDGSFEISNKFSAALHSTVSTDPGCPAPKTFTVMGHTYSISLEMLCYAAHMFSYVVVFAFTMLSTQNFYNTVFRDK